jgi:hypothetical protein
MKGKYFQVSDIEILNFMQQKITAIHRENKKYDEKVELTFFHLKKA